MFGKGKKPALIRADGTASFSRTVSVTNYVAVDYELTRRFSTYIRTFSAHAAKFAKAAGADELNGAYLDGEIEAECALMKASAERQRASHLSLIRHNSHVYGEALSELHSEKAQLERDLAETVSEISELREKAKTIGKTKEERND